MPLTLGQSLAHSKIQKVRYFDDGDDGICVTYTSEDYLYLPNSGVITSPRILKEICYTRVCRQEHCLAKSESVNA